MQLWLLFSRGRPENQGTDITADMLGRTFGAYLGAKFRRISNRGYLKKDRAEIKYQNAEQLSKTQSRRLKTNGMRMGLHESEVRKVINPVEVIRRTHVTVIPGSPCRMRACLSARVSLANSGSSFSVIL